MSWWRRLVKRGEMERHLDAELRFHFDGVVADNRRAGMSEPEARRSARLQFGGIEQVKEECRDARGLAWFEGIFYDLCSALRGLRRDRAFTITAITMLALAIGLNVTIFAVMNTMLFRGVPLAKRNNRLVYIQERYPSGLCCISYPDFEDWRAQARSFEGMAFVGEKRISLSDGNGERPVDTPTFTMSANAFGLLGVQPLLGRDFVAADEEPGAPPVVILNYRFWEIRFAKRPDIVGHIVRIDKVTAMVIGVMPKGFDFPARWNLWMPLTQTVELQERRPTFFMAFGRLAEGATIAGARTELETVNRRLAASYPTTNRDVVPMVKTYSQITVGPNGPAVYGSLWAGAWFILLIACANLANLTLARTLGRSREFSTRIALGAGHWRMVRQILTESLLLAGAGGALGWWIAKWSVRTWATATESPYQILDYTVDVGTLAYLIAISIAAAFLFGLVPIGRVLQLDVNWALKGDARGAAQGLRSKYLSAALVAGQMALAIMLLSGAGVLTRSLWNVVSANTGVRDPKNILVGSIRLQSEKYPNPATRLRYFDRLEAQLRTIPGIQAESVSSTIPVNSGRLRTFELEGRPSLPGSEKSAQFLTAGPNYFQVVGASALSGRDFNDGDRTAALSVAIVNQAFVETFWTGEQPLGKRLRATDRNQPEDWRTVVGVVPNIMQGDPTRQHFKPLVYIPFQQEPPAGAFFLVKTGVPSNQVARAVRAEVQKLDPDVLLEDFTTLKASFAFRADRMDSEHSEMEKYASVAPIFAVIALLIAVVGLSAVIAHSVSQRTKEIGIRMAIGAAAEDVRRMILHDGMLPVAIGMILGLGASLAVNRILQSQLVGVSPYDPITMAGAPLVLILVALLACQIPARRAMNVNPAVTLRHD